ncbi:helix-turn-helix domain-containing protein [Candidatus Sulfurimonas baltica]|uniref:Helix-turn-helix domain-containing protein n=1 Tax=Candidatus Sulfurimonas baltica TaxID=2740404 RepID=A0A7S7LXC0_9BACT|nr:helix-turn-helix domain-containing protein [Candidatus Sulfurimonas baltica]QOY53198.1 helix-turn-helix domain-containing protein [Candidatus Sulfurimonas baltica]
MKDEKKEMEDRLFAIFVCLVLSRKQVSKALNKSLSTIDRWRKQSINLEYSKSGDAKNSTIEYSISEIARYIVSNKIKVL